MIDGKYDSDVPEDTRRLTVIDKDKSALDLGLILNSLKQDLVVLIKNTGPEHADNLMKGVADRLGLRDSLELQSGFADYEGQRQIVSKYFMSVNERTDYQFFTPHSEGTSFSSMQLAAFFCYENSTDGGESILMNVDDTSIWWESLLEKVTRGRLTNGPLPRHEIWRARGLHRLNLPADILRDGDKVLQEIPSEIPGLSIVDALTKTQKSSCRILERKVNVYWDSVHANDFDSAREYVRLLRKWGLLKEPPNGIDLHQLDAALHRRVLHSGVDYGQLFKCKVTCKLAPGDFLIQNNFTWTHSTNNWTPNSGIRKITASFA